VTAGGGGRGTVTGSGGGGGSGTVTVGRLTVGGGGTALRPLPVHEPSNPSASVSGRTTETDRRGINSITEIESRPFRGGREMARDYYEVLGVRRDADQNTIKRAYRTRSRALHPDVSGDSEADSRFREVSEAYAVLSRPDSRRLYDRFGWRGRGRGFARPPGRIYHATKRGLLQDLESLIASAAGRRPEREPTKVIASLEVDAYEAHIGATRRIEVDETRRCVACGGSGHRKVISERESGRFLSLVACLECGGTGEAGERRTLDVPVPPRVRDLDRVPVGPEQVAIVKIVPARDRVAVRAAALSGLVVALGFLLFLLAL
jgi:DnaJ-class molecular chaperone